MRRHKLFLPFLMLVLAMLACNLPSQTGSGTTETPGVDATTPPATIVTETPVAPTTPAVDNITPTTPPVGLPNVDFNGLKFSYSVNVASGVKPQIAPLTENDPTGTGWIGPDPEHYQVDFSGYKLDNGSHTAQILLYAVKVYADSNAPAGDIAKKLDDMLRSNQTEDKNLPFLPMWNAGQVFHSQAKILPFQNGRGLRYLTCYAQALVPLDKGCLFYTYQALTADGKYYISATFPVDLKQLEGADFQKMFNDSMSDGTKYQAYLDKVSAVIGQAPANDFQPSLDDLDAVVKSIVATPTVELKGLTVKTLSCPGAMATRLKKDLHVRVTITDGTPLRLRSAAGKSAKVKELIKEGVTMVVTGEAVCQDGGIWWPVKVDTTKSSGWVLEGENGVYLVEPWNN
jgi:hypothetical protein